METDRNLDAAEDVLRAFAGLIEDVDRSGLVHRMVAHAARLARSGRGAALPEDLSLAPDGGRS